MVVKAETDWTTTAFPAYIAFETTATTGRIERLKIMGTTGYVGVGVTVPAVPTQRLEVNGGVRLNPTSSRPTCDNSIRGTFWVTKEAVGTADKVSVCVKGDSEDPDKYGWRNVWN